MLNNGEGTGRKKQNLCHGIGLRKRNGKEKPNHTTCLVHPMSEAGMDHGWAWKRRDSDLLMIFRLLSAATSCTQLS